MIHLLFVDDEERVLDGLRRLLRSQRDVWECHFATSAAAAMDIIRTTPLDAVVTDINMPGETGLDLLRDLRQAVPTQHLPVLMLTGNTELDTKRWALELGATDFINKPVDSAELIARLQNVIAIKLYQDEIAKHSEELEQRVRERTSELECSRREVIYRLAKAAETRDKDTGNHIVRVGIASQLLARFLKLPDEFQEQILLTAPLHDIGKIGIPDEILLKPGPLSPEERLQMQRHCELGADILADSHEHIFSRLEEEPAGLSNSNLLEMAARIAFYHHERWDGTGYPNKVRAFDIPIEARIVAVADVYDALRSTRSYKTGYEPDAVLRVIVESSGSHFDPTVVEAFSKHFEELERTLAPLRDDLQERIAA